MDTETVYLGHDNSIDLILKADDVAVDLTSVTQMTLSFKDTLISSDNGDTDPIRWKKVGYVTGETRLFLGDQAITPGIYPEVPLVVYDPTNPGGVIWDYLPILVKEDPEAPAPPP